MTVWAKVGRKGMMLEINLTIDVECWEFKDRENPRGTHDGGDANKFVSDKETFNFI